MCLPIYKGQYEIEEYLYSSDSKLLNSKKRDSFLWILFMKMNTLT